MASQPVIITFNGLKHGTLPNTIIKNELKLPFLDRYIIVQIECDRLIMNQNASYSAVKENH